MSSSWNIDNRWVVRHQNRCIDISQANRYLPVNKKLGCNKTPNEADIALKLYLIFGEILPVEFPHRRFTSMFDFDGIENRTPTLEYAMLYSYNSHRTSFRFECTKIWTSRQLMRWLWTGGVWVEMEIQMICQHENHWIVVLLTGKHFF